jgi:transposase-like protein
MLLPPAVQAFLEEVEREVEQLCSKRDAAGRMYYRWGSHQGSIQLDHQKVRLSRPRVINVRTRKEVPLSTWERFQDTSRFEETVLKDGLRKISQRDFSRGSGRLESSHGTSKSSVSRHWKHASQKKLDELHGRDLAPMEILAVLIDGKRFHSRGVVVALGVSATGKKYTLGIYECSTESKGACTELLNDLRRRGLPDHRLLFVVDGGKGLNSALNELYDAHDRRKCRAIRVRCFIHKLRNIRDALSEEHISIAESLFNALRGADTKVLALECSLALEEFLREANESAYRSYLEAKPDLLAIHDLQLSPQLRAFFSTTNGIESLNSLAEEDLRRVKKWHATNQFQRWLATSCLNNEKRMHRVFGYRGLVALKVALAKQCVVQHGSAEKMETQEVTKVS